MRYLNYVGEVEEFKPSYFAFKNVGVRAVNEDTQFKHVGKSYLAIGGFLISRPMSDIDEYIPTYRHYGIRRIIPKVEGDAIFASPEAGVHIDPDLMEVFKKVCIRYKGRDIYLRTSGKNKGKFYYLRRTPMLETDVPIKVNFNRQRYL